MKHLRVTVQPGPPMSEEELLAALKLMREIGAQVEREEQSSNEAEKTKPDRNETEQ